MSRARRFSDIDVVLETHKCLRICVLRLIVASYLPYPSCRLLLLSSWGSHFCIYFVLDGPGYDEPDDRTNRRPFRKEKDDKVHDSIIEERIQRERPCRTLFIRNIKASPTLKISGVTFLKPFHFFFAFWIECGMSANRIISMKRLVRMSVVFLKSMEKSRLFLTWSQQEEWSLLPMWALELLIFKRWHWISWSVWPTCCWEGTGSPSRIRN